MITFLCIRYCSSASSPHKPLYFNHIFYGRGKKHQVILIKTAAAEVFFFNLTSLDILTGKLTWERCAEASWAQNQGFYKMLSLVFTQWQYLTLKYFASITIFILILTILGDLDWNEYVLYSRFHPYYSNGNTQLYKRLLLRVKIKLINKINSNLFSHLQN